MAKATIKPTDKVRIRLFKDSGKYKDDVFVAVNGRGYQIQRGVEVEVPRYVADVIEESIKHDGETASMISKIAEKEK